jgi:hypothetical protein
MKLVKHNVIENYLAFDGEDRLDVIVQELSKVVMMFPKAVTDVFDMCNIKYKTSEPKELQKLIEQNSNDLKMLNKLVKLSLVANMELQNAKGQNTNQKSFNEMVANKDDYFKENQDIQKDAVLLLRDMFGSKKKTNFAKEVNEYLNMDGDESQSMSGKPFVSSIDNTPMAKFKSLLLIGLLIGGAYYFIKKNK